jgi:hypothetical protein
MLQAGMIIVLHLGVNLGNASAWCVNEVRLGAGTTILHVDEQWQPTLSLSDWRTRLIDLRAARSYVYKPPL